MTFNRKTKNNRKFGGDNIVRQKMNQARNEGGDTVVPGIPIKPVPGSNKPYKKKYPRINRKAQKESFKRAASRRGKFYRKRAPYEIIPTVTRG